MNGVQGRCKVHIFVAAVALSSLALGTLGDACPFCNLPVLKDTKEQDNEVAMAIGGKRILYRCIMCAIAEAKVNRPNADVTIDAPSTEKGQPVKLRRLAGAWTVEPAGTVFIWVDGSHGECQSRYRAARTRAQFDQFVQANSKLLKGAKPLSLAEVLKKIG